MDKISIIIPIYNAEMYLREAIEAVLSQSYKKLEVILVDDGSKDHCFEICKEYEKMDKRVRIVKKENGGLSDARNAGLKVATGDFIMFCDADDFFELTACEKMLKEITKQQADFVTANYIYTYQNGEKWNKPVFPADKYSNFELSIDDHFHSFYVLNSSVCNKIFRKSFLDELGIEFVKGLYAEDAIFTTYCFIKAKKVVYLPDVIYNYRQRQEITSISYSCDRVYFDKINKAYQLIYQNFKDNEEIGFYRYIYAKNMNYIIYKLIDSKNVTKEEKKKVFQEMRWFFVLSKQLDVPACQKCIRRVIDSIEKKEYHKALAYCDVIQEVRSYMTGEIKEDMSRPKQEDYAKMAEKDIEYAKKKTDQQVG